jgi:hypothetical protein
MKKDISGILILLSFTFLLFSCWENSVSDIPQIRLLSVVPNKVTAFRDSVVFTISYRDGNGDIGISAPDSHNLFLRDERVGLIYPFRIQPLIEAGSRFPIKGKLRIVLDHIPMISDTLSVEEVRYSIFLKDQDQHSSNIVQSRPITVRR